MHKPVVQSVKTLFGKALHFKHHGKCSYKEGLMYIMLISTIKEMSILQYSISLGCLTLWRKSKIITGKLQVFIFVTMKMEKPYN